MTLKSIKPGRFKPNCTGCKEPFLLVVSDTDPPQLKTARIASTSATKLDAKTNATAQAPAAHEVVREVPVPVPKPESVRAEREETIEHTRSIPSVSVSSMGAAARTLDQTVDSQPQSRDRSLYP